MNRIYIISGPAGVGKSTTARMLAESFEQSTYIEGDIINHMVGGGYMPPWESEASLELVWKNIADLSVNFVLDNKNVIIDYVAFPGEVELFSQRVIAECQDTQIVYIVLWAQPDELLKRDAGRVIEHQMGERCLALIKEFEAAQVNERYLYDTTDLTPDDLDQMIGDIKGNSLFIYS